MEGGTAMTEELLTYVQIEYVPSPTQAEGVPWAVVAVDYASPSERILVHEIEESGSGIEAQDRDYLDALLADWKMTLNEHGAALLDSLSELAIGPLRTAVAGECAKEELRGLVRTLGETTRKGPSKLP